MTKAELRKIIKESIMKKYTVEIETTYGSLTIDLTAESEEIAIKKAESILYEAEIYVSNTRELNN